MSRLDEYGDPTEDQIQEWNEANDYTNEGDDFDDEANSCDMCEEPLPPDYIYSTCQSCQDDYDRANPHPLDIAEREELEDRSAGLEPPWWAYK